MLTKEYRIALPLTIDEYRIAQLYMIAKKSREETRGAGSGVEILVNEPYENGPGGSGQYTHKIYHVGSHLPGWFKALLPKSALVVEEEAWNAYPYTKTRYTCPFVEKFFLEIETKYFNDSGNQDNVFELTGSEMRSRIVDVIDVVKDQLYGADYRREEDPRYYVSQKTCRGPLGDSWAEEHWQSCKGRDMPLDDGRAIMCAYKLCRVEFKYWGMQSKIEKFIHDVALRKTMLRAHRQAWAWQDEWFGMTMEDIRILEKETQEMLARRMASEESSGASEADTSVVAPEDAEGPADPAKDPSAVPSASPSMSPQVSKLRELRLNPDASKSWSRSNSRTALHSPSGSASNKGFDLQLANWRMESCARQTDSSSDEEFYDCEEEADETTTLTKWSSLELFSQDDDNVSPGSDFNKEDSIFKPVAFLHQMHVSGESGRALPSLGGCSVDTSLPCSPTMSPAHHSIAGANTGPGPCLTSVLVLVLHSGSVLDITSDAPTKKSDLSTFRSAFDNVARQHYHSMSGRVCLRLVACPSICVEALGVLSSLSPYSFNSSSSPSAIDGSTTFTHDSVPLGALPMFATCSLEYQECVTRVVASANQAYHEFLRSEEGNGFVGQVAIIGDSVGAILGYDALCRTNQLRFGSETSIAEVEVEPCSSPGLNPKPNPLISISDGSSNEEGGADDALVTDTTCKQHQQNPQQTPPHPLGRQSSTHLEGVEAKGDTSVESQIAAATGFGGSGGTGGCSSCSGSSNHGRARHLEAPNFRRRSSCSSEQSHFAKLDFEVSDFFTFGSPLGMVIAFRKFHSFDDRNTTPPRPACTQMYNLFHPTDPLSCRIEPLISGRFSRLAPVKVARYAKYPLGDGQPYHLLECIQSNAQLFVEPYCPHPNTPGSSRRMSAASMQSVLSGVVENIPLQTVTALTQKWWGTKRLDYALYCPEGLANFPSNALPHLFHASYWESADVIAFILRQLSRTETSTMQGSDGKEGANFSPSQPREKWMKKRTSVKLKNVNANHRANDVIVREGVPQVLTARFVYGPLDMVSLSGEKVDIHIMKDSPNGEWTYMSTELTDKNGRATYGVPEHKTLAFGMYPVKMVVRGDHTSVDFFLVVIPPKTECVVFSIDGSFTASMSVTGRDPKVRAGAVDVVRHWQELGYLIIYVTGRPDMQQQKVVAWLSQHNFPHGLVSFVDGLSADPLRHKADYLRHLVNEADVIIHAAYGSSKDIAVYTAVGLKPDRIYIVGKASKKQQAMAQVLSDGYASHLSDLTAHGGSRPAQGNARMVIPRGCFGLPGQSNAGLRRRRSAKRTPSYPIAGSGQGQGPGPSEGVIRPRGVSPKPASSRM